MSDSGRTRKSVVCNVCRKRKVKCDRQTPACTSCRKSNCVHLCVYEERESRRGRRPKSVSPPGSPNSSRVDIGVLAGRQHRFNLRQKTPVSTHVPKEKREKLQKEQIQFQQQLQIQQHYQQTLQHQMAQKYGVTGATSGPQVQSPMAQYQLHQVHISSPMASTPTPTPQPLTPFGYANDQQIPQQNLIPWNQQNNYNPGMVDPLQQPQMMMPPPPPQQQQMPFSGQFLPPQQQPQFPPQFLQQQPFPPAPPSQFPPQQQQQSPFLPYPQEQPPKPPQPNGVRGPSTDDDNIDPSLYRPDEITNIFQEFTENAEQVDIENEGLFGNGTMIKRDIGVTLFYTNLMKQKERQKPLKSGTDKYSKLLENERGAKLAKALKYETLSLADVLQKVARILPTKKVIWSMLDRFFGGISDPFLPVLDETEFSAGVAAFIGSRELNDARVQLSLDIDDNDQLVNLYYLLNIIRFSQFSLMFTTRLDKQSNYLLKNSQLSNEYDVIIDFLYALLNNIKIPKLSKLRVVLFREFLSMVDPNGSLNALNSDQIALELNLNNRNAVRDDRLLTQTWFYTYFACYYARLKHGLPLMYGEDFHNLGFVFKPATGANAKKVLMDDYVLQTKTNEIWLKLFSRIYDYSNCSGIPVANLTKWMAEVDEFHSKALPFDQYKLENVSGYSRKIVKTLILTYSKYVHLNVFQILLIHYEHHLSCKMFVDTLVQALVKVGECCHIAFDILRNYSNYFPPGNELILYPQVLMVLDKILLVLRDCSIRCIIARVEWVALLQLQLNLVTELEKHVVLKSYLLFWKVTLRTKLFLHLLRKQHQGKLNLFESRFKIGGKKIVFSDILSNMSAFTENEWTTVNTAIGAINETFANNEDFGSVSEFYKQLKCDEPEFNIELFQ